MSDLQASTLQSSQADVWYLKRIEFRGEPYRIITQNFNGPCSFIAICNILILRKNIIIEPPTRTNVSYEFLSQLVAEYLIKHSPNTDISASLSILPHTTKGLDLNPLFTSSTSFLPATETAGGELKLFSQAGIDLVHGWLVDPESPEAIAMLEENTEDYDNAVALIAEADHIAGGLLVPFEGGYESSNNQAGRPQEEWTDAERKKVQNALTIRHFLEQTQSQLTYHGLFHLASTLAPGSLVALLRNSHLSVLYKSGPPNVNEWQALDDNPHPSQVISEGHKSAEYTADIQTAPAAVTNDSAERPTLSTESQEPASTPAESPDNNTSTDVLTAPSSEPNQLPPKTATSESPVTSTAPTTASPNVDPVLVAAVPPASKEHDSALYTLATDQVFLQELSVVWERIEDVDGAAGLFVDSAFVRSSPAGGDWAGRTAEDTARDIQRAQEEAQRVSEGGVGLSDHELARQLQAEEEQLAMQQHEAYMQEQQRVTREEEDRRQKELHARREKEPKKRSTKKDCRIM